jgi:putative ABC transport system ATP-binding protein
MMATILETKGLCKQYRMGEVTVDALRSVDFAVQEGEFVAIMGPSGSGKSTLMHILGGLDNASGGEITLRGKPISGLNDDNLTLVRRREMGFIFQFFNLLPTLTAAENVALPLLIDGKAIDDRLSSIGELLDLVGLNERKDHKPNQLSGGQQQRVAIARALVTQPAIVLADEPTGNLDSHATQEILTLLRHTCDQRGQTIIMVTHDPRAAAFADRVVYLKDGRIVRELGKDESAVGDTKRSTQTIRTVMAELNL